MSKNILNFEDFKKVLEAKKDSIPFEYIIEDIEEIIDSLFDKSKNILYKVGAKYIDAKEVLKGKKNPTAVKFDITPEDYKIGYQKPINNEYTEGILKKREYDVTLEFADKSTSKDDKGKEIYNIEFKVKLDKITPERLAKAKKDKNDDDEVQVQDDEKLNDF